MTTPFFSIIIPVYKVERYLHQCVDSVLAQSYTNYEIILVDDGSPDSCPQICDEYSAKDLRIRTVHCENDGQSAARNTGLSSCTAGKESHYIIYLDSDDYWEGTDALQNIANNVIKFNCDIVLFASYDIFPDGTTRISRGNYDLNYINSHSKHEVLSHLFRNNQFPGAVWILATRKSTIEENEISFVVGNNAEDYAWLMQLFYVANNISAVNQAICYHRRDVAGSVTSCAKPAGQRGLLYAIQYWLSARKRGNEYRCFDMYIVRIYILALLHYARLSNEDKCMFKSDLNRYKSVLKLSGRLADKVCLLIISLLGVDCTSKLTDRIYRLMSGRPMNHYR